MSLIKNIAIIGGGASGILAGIFLSKKNYKVTIFENNDALGKKILASGNGRCNIASSNIDKNSFYTNQDFVEEIIKSFDFKKLEEIFNSFGLFLDIKEDFKVYPASNEAKSVMSVLNAQVDTLGINVLLETKVLDIKKHQDTFTIKTSNKEYKNFTHTIIATGSIAYPQLGASEDGYNFAKSFKHTIKPLHPTLVGLVTKEIIPKQLHGAKTSAQITLYIDNKKIKSLKADTLFTKYGLSGFGIFDISYYVTKALLNNEKIKLSLDLIPNISSDQILKHIHSFKKQNISILTLLCGFLNTKISKDILKTLNIDLDIKTSSLNNKQIEDIIRLLKNKEYSIIDHNGYKHAEVVAGGVNVDEIDNITMMSKKVNNLFFLGEVLDITGKRGGYNLHFAFASAYRCALHLSHE